MRIIRSSTVCFACVLFAAACGLGAESSSGAQEAAAAMQGSTSLKAMPKGQVGFHDEAVRAASLLSCGESKTIPASDGLGAMYSCISGPAQTVKFFINEDPATGSVKNAKFIWNDWFRDVGYGVHADRQVALAMLDGILAMYPSNGADQIRQAFLNNKDQAFESGSDVFEYTYHRGPALDERMIVVTPNSVERAQQINAAEKPSGSVFGIEMTSTKAQLLKMGARKASSPGVYAVDNPPLPHERFADYKVWLSDSKGICKIVANDVTTDGDGHRLIDTYLKLRDELESEYGKADVIVEPQWGAVDIDSSSNKEVMDAILEMRLSGIMDWSVENGNPLPSGVERIKLESDAFDATRGATSVFYVGYDVVECLQSIDP